VAVPNAAAVVMREQLKEFYIGAMSETIGSRGGRNKEVETR
jgi:hypothetical protein